MIDNILDLANKVEQDQVTRVNGAGQDIVFEHIEANATTNTRAFLKSGDYREDVSDNRKQDSKTFFSVFLDIEPKRKDTITKTVFLKDIQNCYSCSQVGKTWIVDEWSGDNPYDIDCVSNVRYLNRREN